jgi:hypothetical protein
MDHPWMYTMDKSGETPATRASKSGYTALAEMLLSQERAAEAKRADTTRPPSDQDAYWGMSRSVYKMMDAKPRENAGTPGGKDSPLHRATCEGYKEEAKNLINSGADVDELNEQGLTPLHLIALNGRCDLAELLLDHGADINQRENYTGKLTPMAMALLMGYDDLVEVMAARGGVC